MTPELPDDTAPHVGALMRDEPRTTAAVAQVQADAVRRHRLLGLPLPEWRDGRVVEASREAPTLGER